MKKTSKLLGIFLIFMLFSIHLSSAQEKEKPMYLTVTTMHWNMDLEDFSMKDWKAVEKEFLDKVTSKNEYILATNYGLHHMTADNTELVYVQLYKSWTDIEKAGDKNGELIKAAWPDEAKREAYFKKRNAYYADKHSDEIYVTMPGAKQRAEVSDEPVLFYVRKSHFAFPEEGTNKEFNELRDGFLKNVIHKNTYIKGYYPYVHAWGADKRDYVEVFVVDSLADLEKALEEIGKLNKARFKDEAAQKAWDKKVSKYFTGYHGDYVYKSVPELSLIHI